MKALPARSLLSVTVALAISNMAAAQEDTTDTAVEQNTNVEIIEVNARRKVERLQDVPLTVNVVNSETLDKLNLRNLENVDTLVAGLTLESDPLAPNASMRGVRFDAFASGNNSTVAFYQNDAPIAAMGALQAMFDIGYVEVLRGPQGTLRGIAAPSGSIALTTIRPDTEEWGGYVDVTVGNNDVRNYRGAVNIPIVEDVLAIRVAGMFEQNNGNATRSIVSGEESQNETTGFRGSVKYTPTDNLEINLMHQLVKPERVNYFSVESASIANPDLPEGDRLIKASDRLASSVGAATADQELERTVLEVQWELDPVVVNYSGSMNKNTTARQSLDEKGGFYGAEYPEVLQVLGQDLTSIGESDTHELRFSTAEPIWDKLDLVGGVFRKEDTSTSNPVIKTPIFISMVSPGTFTNFINETQILSAGESEETSYFANATYYISEATELSAGIRRIDFTDEGSVSVGGRVIDGRDDEYQETLYSASAKHHFNRDFMVYASYGTSWRPGLSVTGNFSLNKSDRERSFLILPPETSDSIELGSKGSFLDGALKLYATLYRQEFENYPYRVGGEGVKHIATEFDSNSGGLVETVSIFNFVSPVPVVVNGVEIEASYQLSDNVSLSSLVSYSKGEIDNGLVACDDFAPADGIPDTSGYIPSVEDIREATGGDTVAACSANFRSSYAPLLSATFTGEYLFELGEYWGYARSMISYKGDSQNDPTNALDDVDSYAIFNLYAGINAPDDSWELSVYVKNLFDNDDLVARDFVPTSARYQVVNPMTGAASGGRSPSDYRLTSVVAPREIGVNLKYRF